MPAIVKEVKCRIYVYFWVGRSVLITRHIETQMEIKNELHSKPIIGNSGVTEGKEDIPLQVYEKL